MSEKNRIMRALSKFFSYVLAFVMLCSVLPVSVHAEDGDDWGNPDDGQAYATLMENGDLVFYRSTQMPDYFTETQTMTDIDGNPHTGVLFYGIEEGGSQFGDYKHSILNAYVEPGQTIHPTSMESLFEGCQNMQSIDLSGFDTSHTANMAALFKECVSLTSLDLSGFVTGNVTTMKEMFDSVNKVQTLDLSNFNTSSVTDMSEMFISCSSLENLYISSFNTSNVTDMSGMFGACYNLTGVDVSGFDTSNVTNMKGMFALCYQIDGLDVSGFNTSKVTDMNGMFNGCNHLTQLNVRGFDTSNVTDMASMFKGCTSLNELNVDSFSTGNVRLMTGMFSDCMGLSELNVSGFDTSNVIDMDQMFMNVSGLTSLDLRNFNTDSVQSMNTMFYNCTGLEELDLTSFNTSQVFDMFGMFTYCTSLRSVSLGKDFSVWKTDAPLPEGTWVNGEYSYSETDLIPAFKQNPYGLQGTWIKAVLPESIRLSEESIRLRPGETAQLSVTVLPESTTDKTVTWSSDDTEVASVDDEGNVTANGDGATVIKAETVNGLTASCLVTVEGVEAAYAVLQSSGDLVFFRSRQVPSGSGNEQTIKDIFGTTYTGRIFTGFEDEERVYPFIDCHRDIRNVYVANGQTIYPKNMRSMFSMCQNLVSADLSGFDTSAVTDMSFFFENCTSLQNVIFGNFITSNVTNMYGMFAGCESLQELDLRTFDTSSVTDMGRMFDGCRELANIDVSGFNTSNVTDMAAMFSGCITPRSLDLSGFDTSNVTEMTDMFKDCTFIYIDLGEGFTVWNADAPLPQAAWVNGDYIYSETDLIPAYVQDPSAMQGTWMQAVYPEWIRFTQNTMELSARQTSQLIVEMGPPNTNVRILTWTSSNPGVASVDGNGNVAAIAAGEAVITAETLNGLSAECTVTVQVTDEAYAVLEEDGDLIFFRSEQIPIDTSEPQDIRDINGKLYTGVVFSGIEENCTDFIAGIKRSIKHVYVAENQTIHMPDNMVSMFEKCTYLVSADLRGFDTSAARLMIDMFRDCAALTSVDLSTFDTPNLQSMHGMFAGCNNLKSVDLSNFDTSEVNGMAEMFYNCHKLTSLDLSNFDTSNVNTMWSMFYNCVSLESLDITGFDTSDITDMSDMFYNCRSLTSLDLSSFDTSNVTSMDAMFCMDSSLQSLDLSNFNTSNVTRMSRIFEGCTQLTVLDVSSFDTSKLTKMSSMFSGCSNVTSLDVSGWNTSNVTDMRNMFYNCKALTELDVSGFDTSNVTDLGSMFCMCENLETIDVSNFNTSNALYMDMMFGGCASVTSLDVSGFDTSNVTSMASMFYRCNRLTSLDVTDFDTSKVTRMGGMFAYNTNLAELDVSKFDTSNVENMGEMFAGCASLTELDLSSFNTEKVTDMSLMFSGSSSLTSLDLSNFITDRVTKMKEMFNNCSSLTNLNVSSFDTSNITNMSLMFSGCENLTNLDLSNFNTAKVSNMQQMFERCHALTNLDLSSFNTAKTTNMLNMFNECDALKTVSLGEGFTVWRANGPLPAGIWVNGDHFYTEKELITAYVQDPAGLQGRWTRAELPDSIALSMETVELDAGTSTQITYTITPDTADIKTVTWTSSDPTVASIDANGIVTGVSAGTAEITAATVNGLTAVCTVTVNEEVIVPGIPQSLTAKNYASTGNIKLTWEAAENAYKYQVFRSTSSSGTYTRIATTENTYYVDTAGENGQTYYYKVRSMTEDSTYSKYSSKKSIKCVETVLVLTAKADTASGSPVLSWNTAEDLKYYQLYRSENDGVTYTKLLNTTSTSKTDSTAEAGKTYWYKVRAIDTESKSGTYSEPVSITAIPSQPTGITTKNNPATGNIRVSWDEMEDAYKYQVYRSTSSNGTYNRIATTENAYYVDTKGESGKTYYYKVRSVTENSVYSKYSSKKSAKCSETVLTLTAKNSTTNGKPSLSWNSAGTVKYYQLYRATSENGTYTKLGNITGTSKSDSTAEVGKTYWYKVRAIDTDGKSGTYSEPVSIVCKPARVTGLKAVNVSSTGKPKLTWTAVEDATKYQVYYSTAKDGTYKRLKETTGTSYTHTGAEAGTTYYYKVRAVTENGTYGAFSTIVSRAAK